MGCTLFWEKFSNEFTNFVVSCFWPDGAIIQHKYLFSIATSNCALQFLACMEKYILAQESFYLQGILNDINEHYFS